MTLRRVDDATDQPVVEVLPAEVWEALLGLPLGWVHGQALEAYLARLSPCCVGAEDARNLSRAIHRYRFRAMPDRVDAAGRFAGDDAPLSARVEEFCSHGAFVITRNG